jgi:glycosyltransferase involved in cell wall biosynthesis
VSFDELRNDNKTVKVKPLITVMTVVFNGAKTLEQTILSVINQSYKNVEFIIIDGGSTDGTLDIIQKYEHAIDYWMSEPDKGIYDAFNKAVTCANGDWLCFIGSDDYLWDNSVLARMAPNLLSVLPTIKLVYGQVAIVSSQGAFIHCIGEPWALAKPKLAFTMAVPHPGLLYRRNWFEQYGSFDAGYCIAGDYENLLRGWPNEDAVFVPDCIAVGVAQGGISSTPSNAIKSLKEVCRAQPTNRLVKPKLKTLLAFISIYIRLALQASVGQKRTFRLLDFVRKLCGKPTYWTKL